MYLIYAPNVRAGGGLVLLQALLSSWTGSAQLRAVLDSRARSKLDVPGHIEIDWVEVGLGGRARAEWQLASSAANAKCILCFHGLPPLAISRRPSAQIVVFLQNRLVIDRSSLRDYPFKTQIRMALERFLFRWKSPHISDVIVQGPTMARDLSTLFGDNTHTPRIHVRPFAAVIEPSPPQVHHRKFDFIYPASGEPHKNHETLLAAWEHLKQEGFAPSLALTLGEQDLALWQQLRERAGRAGLNLTNLGNLPMQAMLQAYRQSGAVVFPSTRESFGLPLVEATMIGLPIVAGELDFVRDVCEPAESFDPTSATSIARAIKRHLGKQNDRVSVLTPEVFWTALTGDRLTP